MELCKIVEGTASAVHARLCLGTFIPSASTQAHYGCYPHFLKEAAGQRDTSQVLPAGEWWS